MSLEKSDQLSDAEADLMDIIWASPTPLSSTEIVETLFRQRRESGFPPIPAPTVQSTMRRLIARKFIAITKVKPKQAVYTATLSREEMVARALKRVERTILKNDLKLILPGLGGVGSTERSEQDKQQASNILDYIRKLAK